MTIALPASSKIIFLDYIFSKGPFFIKIGFVNCNYQTNNLICFILLILMVSAFSVPKAKRGTTQLTQTKSPPAILALASTSTLLYTQSLEQSQGCQEHRPALQVVLSSPSFGKDIRRFEKSSNPGPGAYEPKSTLVAEVHLP